MRRRWVQIEGELVEVTRDYQQPSPDSARDAGVLWNDRQYQDAGDPRFASRTQHREFMKRNGLTTTDDYNVEWRQKEAQRLKVKAGYDPTRKEDIARAISQLNSRR